SLVMVVSTMAHATAGPAAGNKRECAQAEHEPDPVASKPVHGRSPSLSVAAGASSRAQCSASALIVVVPTLRQDWPIGSGAALSICWCWRGIDLGQLPSSCRAEKMLGSARH